MLFVRVAMENENYLASLGDLTKSVLRGIDDEWDNTIISEICDTVLTRTQHIISHSEEIPKEFPKEIYNFFEIFKKHTSEALTVRGKFFSDYYLSITERADDIFASLKIR